MIAKFKILKFVVAVEIIILFTASGFSKTVNSDSCLSAIKLNIQSVLTNSPDDYSNNQINKLIIITTCLNNLQLPTITIALLSDKKFKPDEKKIAIRQKIAIYKNLAHAYSQTRNYNLAEQYFKRIINYYSGTGDQDSLLAVTFELTDMLIDNQNSKKASLYTLLINKIVDTKPHKPEIWCKLLLREAKIATMEHDYYKAIHLHHIAIDSLPSCKKQLKLKHQLALASIYTFVNNIDSAIRTLSLVGKDSVLALSDYYITKSAVYRAKKNFKSASHYFKLFIDENNLRNRTIDNYRNKMLAGDVDFNNLISAVKPKTKEPFFIGSLLLLGIILSFIIVLILLFIILSQRKQFKKRKQDLLKYESVKAKLIKEGENLYNKEKGGVKTRLGQIEKEEKEKKISINKLKQQIDNVNLTKKKLDKVNLEINFQIRSLLSSIIGLSEIFKTEFAKIKNSQLYKYADIVDENASLLLNIIDSFHEYTSIEAGKVTCNITKINAPKIIQGVLNEFEETAKRESVKLVFNNKKMPLLLGDQSFFKKIITLAIQVALNNTNRGFVIIDIDLVKDDTLCMIKIQNTGHGFDSAFLTDIFKPFNREGLNYIPGFNGTGMEYPLISKLAGLMKGEVNVESAIEQGITFTLTLPATDIFELVSVLESDKKSAVNKGALPWKALKVLVVEDDVMNRLLFSKILRGASTLVIVEDGDKALETVGDFFREDETFDLVLMDINLPQPWDGVRLKNKIRELFMPYRSIPFIAQTAYAMQGDREKFISEGFDEYISKPIIKKELVRVSAIVLGKE